MASRVFDKCGTTIFEIMSSLAREHDAINLGQGFPDGNGPADVRAAAAAALEERSNQYPSMYGIPELRSAVADNANRFFSLDLQADEVLVTSGATEALAASMLGHLNPGDEVVLFEPLYDSYVPIVELAGATPRFVRLSPPGWEIDRDALAAAFSDRTAMVLINSPMNPSGKVFDKDDLDAIAKLCVRHDAIALCDEVYEHLTFDGIAHVPMMSRPKMRERTIRIGSAGKTFSLTGWKIGYVSATPALLTPVARAHQFLCFTTAPNLQHGVAVGLGKGDDYFHELARTMQAKRDRLRAGLGELGFATSTCQGTYFIGVDYSGLGFEEGDADFCRLLTQEAKVAAIPMSAFYSSEPPAKNVRFCFCKRDETLDAALSRIAEFLHRREQ